MAQGWKQYLDAGMQFGDMSRAQAQKLVRQLVAEGQLAEGRAKGYVEELVERSRRRTDAITRLVQREVQRQLSALGLATKDDLARLERKLTKGSSRRPSSPTAKKPGAKRSAPRRSNGGRS
jgi:polyhydroxyalkanoate synthesis regulator phasin